MKSVSVADNIMPLGEFKTHLSSVLRRLREDGRPVVVTQRGRAAGVLVSPEDFDALTERARLIAAIEEGLAQADAGLGIDDADIGDDINAFLDARYGPLPSDSSEPGAD